MPKLTVKQEHVMAGVFILGAAGFLFAATKKTGVPAPATTEGQSGVSDLALLPHLVQPSEHAGQIIYTPHRYPFQVGGEVTTMIHFGITQAAVPLTSESVWITAPPSEVGI
jgi:hypothetical protein